LGWLRQFFIQASRSQLIQQVNTIKGSNPVYLLGSGNDDPDSYTMTISNPGQMRGQNNDAGGAGGSVVITKR